MRLYKGFIVTLAVFSSLGTVLCGCRKDTGEEGAEIDKKTIVELDPDAERPRVHFPQHCQQDDPKLNAFIAHALKVCQDGDYDGFCKMMGTSEVPPSPDDFKRIWHGVGDITVISVRSDGRDPAEYYMHGIVRLREADRKGRPERDLVLRAYREMGEWRLSGVNKEITQKVLAADSQPATETQPAGQAESARPRRD